MSLPPPPSTESSSRELRAGRHLPVHRSSDLLHATIVVVSLKPRLIHLLPDLPPRRPNSSSSPLLLLSLPRTYAPPPNIIFSASSTFVYQKKKQYQKRERERERERERKRETEKEKGDREILRRVSLSGEPQRVSFSGEPRRIVPASLCLRRLTLSSPFFLS